MEGAERAKDGDTELSVLGKIAERGKTAAAAGGDAEAIEAASSARSFCSASDRAFSISFFFIDEN